MAGEQTASIQSLDAYDLEDAAEDHSGPGTYFLGRYRVVDEIGVGGMASVHLARADGAGGFQKWIAIKRIHPHLIEDDQFIHMFLDEARIAARISHANVAQVFDLGEDDGTYWIAMEYLHGEPLREVLRCSEDGSKPRMSYDLAARIIADAADGLHAAHDLRGKNDELLGLVHRDVTPHNLFVTYSGTTKVVDFGIAKVAGRLSNTRAGTLKGKLAYMSPEQVQGRDVDRGTDIFALGVVLWEVTTGRRLFRMDSDLETLERVQSCIVPLPSSIHPNFPPALENIVMKALARDRSKRYATAREFGRALQQYLMERGKFVGPEDVAEYLKVILGERIRKRDEHLRWAAEVTQTRAGGGRRSEVALGADAEVSVESYHSEVRAPRPAAGNRPRDERELGNDTRFEGTPSVETPSPVYTSAAVTSGPPASFERPVPGAALPPPKSHHPSNPSGPSAAHHRLPSASEPAPPGGLPSALPGMASPSHGGLPSAMPAPRSPSVAPGTYGALPPVGGPGGSGQLPRVTLPFPPSTSSLPPLTSPSLPAPRSYGTPLAPASLPSFGEGPDGDDDFEEDVHTVIHMAPPSASMNTMGLIDDEAKTTAIVGGSTPSPAGFATPIPAAGNRIKVSPAALTPAAPAAIQLDDPPTALGRPYGDEDAEAKSEGTRVGPLATTPEPSPLTPAGPVVAAVVAPYPSAADGFSMPAMQPMQPMHPMQPIHPMQPMQPMQPMGMQGGFAMPMGVQPMPGSGTGTAPTAAEGATNKPAAMMAVVAVSMVIVAMGVVFLVFQKSRPDGPQGAPLTPATTAAPAPLPPPTRPTSTFSEPEPPTPLVAPPPPAVTDGGDTRRDAGAPPGGTGTVKPGPAIPPPKGVPAAPPQERTPPAPPAKPPPPPEPPAGDSGTLVVRCEPACESVQANSRSLGPSPVNIKLPAGNYTVRLRRSGVPGKSVSTTIVAGKTARVQVDMK